KEVFSTYCFTLGRFVGCIYRDKFLFIPVNVVYVRLFYCEPQLRCTDTSERVCKCFAAKKRQISPVRENREIAVEFCGRVEKCGRLGGDLLGKRRLRNQKYSPTLHRPHKI